MVDRSIRSSFCDQSSIMVSALPLPPRSRFFGESSTSSPLGITIPGICSMALTNRRRRFISMLAAGKRFSSESPVGVVGEVSTSIAVDSTPSSFLATVTATAVFTELLAALAPSAVSPVSFSLLSPVSLPSPVRPAHTMPFFAKDSSGSVQISFQLPQPWRSTPSKAS